ncbi:hypothetical protein JCM10207_001938 [Rhodosporidiobolus poonsookiae]
MGDRRRTLQSSHQPHSTVPSSIPRPSTTLRQSIAPSQPSLAHSSHRQSLAPTAGRARASIAPGAYAHQHGFSDSQQGGSQGSSQGVFSQGHGGPARNLEPPMTVGRMGPYSSIGASMSVGRAGPLRSSMAPGLTQPIDYAPPSERRTSTYRRSTMGAANAFAATPGGGINATSTVTRLAKDPREAKQRAMREAWAREIVEFCTEHHFTTEVKQLMQPTAAQFHALFKFLINQFDPSIVVGAGGSGKKYEEEVLKTLELVQYPFWQSITKSHLQAIGSAQSWPNMLAMLHWLVVTIKTRAEAFWADPELHIPALDFQQRGDSEDVTAHAWLHYAGSTYLRYLAAPDDEVDNLSYEEEEEAFRVAVENSRRAQRRRLDELRAEHDELEREWKELTARPDPIHAYHHHVAAVKKDIATCDEYIVGLTKKMATYERAQGDTEATIEQARQELVQRRAEQSRLEAVVASQKLTPHEIQSLSAEKQALSSQLADATQRYRAVGNRTMNLEVDLHNRVGVASALVAEYDDKAQRLGLLGPEPVAGFEHVPFAQEVNGASDSPVTEGLAALVKPALQQLRARTRDEIKHVMTDDVSVEEKVTKTKEDLGELADQEKLADDELRLVDSEKEKLQEVIDREAQTTDAELQRLQNQVSSISSTIGAALAAAEHRYEERKRERMEAYEQTTAIRRANRDALSQAMENLLSYKEHMTEKTDRLNALVDEASAAFA